LLSPTARKGAGRQARRTHPAGAPFCCIQQSASERHDQQREDLQ
jgi:hypothetical protein